MMLPFFGLCQDTIVVTKDYKKEVVLCKITKVTSLNIFYTENKIGKTIPIKEVNYYSKPTPIIEKQIEKKEVVEIKTKKKDTSPTYSFQPRDAIFTSRKVYFYGYDFTHFKFIEQKRVDEGSQIKVFIFGLIEWMNTNKKEKGYTKWLKKDTVLFDEQTVNNLNAKIKPENIMGFMKNAIPKDSLQNIINQYETKEKTGVGLVQIVECFYRPKKEVYVWFVFFDISTKKILDAYESVNHDADSYHGLVEYWGVGMGCNIGDYLANHYYKELKTFKKKK